MNIRLLISGRNYDAAAAAPATISLDEGATLDDALSHVAALLPTALPGSCLVAVNGVHHGTIGRHASPALGDGDELLLLTPVAGG